MELTSDQKDAYNAIVVAMKSHMPNCVTVINGWAGTGKTTTISILQSKYAQCFKVLCPTGKAVARVKQITGADASTIHSFMYDAREDNEGKVVFSRKTKFDLPDSLLCVIVDEASMVNREMLTDLRRFCEETELNVVLMGDSFQLPPVKDEYFSVFNENDLGFVGFDSAQVVNLTEVVRQAEDSIIVKASRLIREGQLTSAIALFPTIDNTNFVNKIKQFYGDSDDTDTGIFICGTNEKRHQLNRLCRKVLGYGRDPVDGERLVAIKNNFEAEVHNGEIVVLQGLSDTMNRTILGRHPAPKINTQFRSCVVNNAGTDVDVIVCPLEIEGALNYAQYTYKNIVGALTTTDTNDTKGLLHCNYGYAITAHKSQGSEWNEVVILTEGKDNEARWTYTAITRAKQKVFIFR